MNVMIKLHDMLDTKAFNKTTCTCNIMYAIGDIFKTFPSLYDCSSILK